ncbi:FadR family transcriptional regulator [Flaviflexus ciconiae]|uniref:FadR family transcriptional regulator n=1 Tax=Flaviflexus ciconiae TaxID=2496867 RepID=A0A3Q9G5H1_9ACTO|nr:FadR/GntR family transcriptional regulator [Flaviflexus ciconiae]AZQ77847.1 FadR family transcriptional regulator [Flaviflexus ciconiae]
MNAGFGDSSRIIRPISLSQQVVEDLHRRILDKHLAPGTPLPSERELCTIYGVSRTVIREAVKVLSTKGLIQSVPGSGLVVGRTNIGDVAEVMRLFMRSGTSLRYEQLHEVRLALEVSVGGLTSHHTTPELTKELFYLCDELEISGNDLVHASRLDFDFHRTIAQASQNEFFDVIFGALEGALMETRVATFSMDPSRISIVTEAHRRIARGIADSNEEATRVAMADHLIEVKETWDKHPEMVNKRFPHLQTNEDSTP